MSNSPINLELTLSTPITSIPINPDLIPIRDSPEKPLSFQFILLEKPNVGQPQQLYELFNEIVGENLKAGAIMENMNANAIVEEKLNAGAIMEENLNADVIVEENLNGGVVEENLGAHNVNADNGAMVVFYPIAQIHPLVRDMGMVQIGP